MNKEIIKQEAQYDYLKDEVHCLYAEKKELQQRIDKALELLQDDDYLQYDLDCYRDPEEVISILKGSDSNE